MTCDECTTYISALDYMENGGLCDECYNERENIELEEEQIYRDEVTFQTTLSVHDVDLYLAETKGDA